VFVTFGGSCSGRDVGSVILSSDGTGSLMDDAAVFMVVDVAAVVVVLSLVVLPIEE
jgi:hypothetical protein